MKHPKWLRIPVMPEMPELPDHGDGIRNLDRRAGMGAVSWVCFGVALVLIALACLCGCDNKPVPPDPQIQRILNSLNDLDAQTTAATNYVYSMDMALKCFNAGDLQGELFWRSNAAAYDRQEHAAFEKLESE